MPETASPRRTAGPKPALAAFSAVAAAWVFVLVALGAFTTSIGAGMAFPDWPLSNGSIDPKGWLSNLSMFAEHSHRLSAMVMGTLTGILAVWLHLRESRPWLRKMGYFAFALVVVQGILGGLRVLLNSVQVPSLETSVGRLLAMLHACVAQAFACVLIAIALSLSRCWIERGVPVGPGVRRAGLLCCAVIFVQLGVAAVMRHSFAGLAIPTFPWSTTDHHLLPDDWNFGVAINFTHRVVALLVAAAIVVFFAAIWRDPASRGVLKGGSLLLAGLVAVQITLGAFVILTYRNPAVTTSHVLVGALTLVTTFFLTWLAHRDAIQGAPGA
ncbi:MAG TPA: COX15/CtaA family protein [Opitutaceae bacterium]|jgi:cytochrome c oxidase assembly protein subunit 15